MAGLAEEQTLFDNSCFKKANTHIIGEINAFSFKAWLIGRTQPYMRHHRRLMKRMEQLIAAGVADDPIDVDMNNFMTEVIERSSNTPVVVQFWAPWCGPCKQLGPVLQKTVVAAKGKVRMVRVNIDDNQQIAQQLRVQSVPTVYGFYNGQPVDAFAGAQPESTVTVSYTHLTLPTKA